MDTVVDNAASKLGLHDFFNVIFSGGIFLLGLLWILPDLWILYKDINIGNEKYICVLFAVYFVGLCLQELGRLFDSMMWKTKENMVSRFLWKEDTYVKYLKTRPLYWIFNVLDRKHKVFYKRQSYMGCTAKQDVSRRLGKEILRKKKMKCGEEFIEDQCKYIFAYCYYYIESKGRHVKYEKMRSLYDMSRILLSSAFILSGLAISFYCYKATELWKVILLLGTVILFYYRTSKLARYKARMLMTVYEVCVEMNNKDKKRNRRGEEK